MLGFPYFRIFPQLPRYSKTRVVAPKKNMNGVPHHHAPDTIMATATTDDAVATDSHQSDYEKRRAHNIERNNSRLRALGLISALEEKRSNASAWGKTIVENSNENEQESDGEWNKCPRKRRRARKSNTSPSRTSLRLQGITPEGGEIEHEPLDTPKEREERVRECREVRLRAAKAVAEAGAEKAAKENPTATYEHCLMRVKSMTDKALANRVKAIERAAGKHCVVKMAIFKSCLQDEGMWELAKLASDALERLKALQPPPEQ